MNVTLKTCKKESYYRYSLFQVYMPWEHLDNERIKQSLNLKSEICHQFKHKKLFAEPGECSGFWDYNILSGDWKGISKGSGTYADKTHLIYKISSYFMINEALNYDLSGIIFLFTESYPCSWF